VATDYTAPGDYDGDGKFDFAIQRPGATANSQSTFYIQRSTDGGFDQIGWGLPNDIVAPGDYDGDGKTDVAVIREGNAADAPLTWYVRRSADGALLQFVFGLTGTDINVQNDYDGDGKTDVAIWRNSDGKFWIRPSTGGGGYTVIGWGVPGDYPVASYDTH
jgi:hypothetical protein